MRSHSAPQHASQPDDRPGSEQRQDVQDEEWSIFWFGTLKKTSIVCAVPGGHFGTLHPLPQAMMKLEVHVGAHGPTAAGSHIEVPGQRHHLKPYRYSGSGPLSDAILKSVSYTSDRGHVDAGILCCLRRPW